MVQMEDIPDIFKNSNAMAGEEMETLSQKADDVISSLRSQFVSVTKENIIKMEKILNEVRNDKKAQAQILPNSFFRMAHDIKGQGSTFGYPVLTDLGVDICNILRNRDSWSNEELSRVEENIADMRIVIQLPYDSKSSVLQKISKRLKDV